MVIPQDNQQPFIVQAEAFGLHELQRKLGHMWFDLKKPKPAG